VNATLNVTVVGEDGTTAADIRARAEAGSEPAPAPAEDDDESGGFDEEDATDDEIEGED
jgi:hypothetical protein